MDMFATKFMERNEYLVKANFETVVSSETYSTPRRKKKKSNGMSKRRFSDEQIRSLESIFYSSQSKLDPRKKVQLATNLGLQPRQVAIWFQNRKQRWKSKQIEKDFTSLRANYDNLASQFESLQEENNSLLAQNLSELIQKMSPFNIVDTGCETEAMSSRLQEELEQGEITYRYNNQNNQNEGKKWIENGEELTGMNPLEDKSINMRCSEAAECQLMDLNGSSEKWCEFDLGGSVFEYQTYSGLQWQNFWG